MTDKDDILVSKCQCPDEEYDEPEEDMTIGIGFHCKDGILIAGDRQRNKGDSARSVTKVKDFDIREGLSGIFIGAGASSAVEMVFDEINISLQDHMPVREVMRVVDKVSKRIYKKHINMPGREKKPRFSMLIGLWTESENLSLLSAASDSPARVIRDQPYKAIGSGSQVANFVVSTFSPRFNGSVEDALQIAVMAVKAAKEYDPSCGGETNIIGLLEDGALIKPRNAKEAAKLEGLQADLLISLKNMFPSGSDFSDPPVNLKAEMEKLQKKYRRYPLLVQRFPQPFTKAHFEQALRKVSRRIQQG